jgi:hypothetical protein
MVQAGAIETPAAIGGVIESLRAKQSGAYETKAGLLRRKGRLD